MECYAIKCYIFGCQLVMVIYDLIINLVRFRITWALPSSFVPSSFQEGLTEDGGPTLNVGGTILSVHTLHRCTSISPWGNNVTRCFTLLLSLPYHDTINPQVSAKMDHFFLQSPLLGMLSHKPEHTDSYTGISQGTKQARGEPENSKQSKTTVGFPHCFER